METGIYPHLDRREYDALTDRCNWSRLKSIGRSPLHYQHGLTEERPDTPALQLGRAVHVAVLEPELFSALYVVWTGGRRAGKAWDAFVEESAGYEILTEEEHEQCAAIQRAVREDPIAGPYVRGGRSEVTLAWEHTLPAVADMPAIVTPCKGRLDYLQAGAIVDLKTCRDASIDGFGRAAWRLQYHAQAAFYRDGYRAITGEALPFKIVAVETAAPYAVTVFDVPEHVLEIGREEYTGLLARLDWCRQERQWPAYADAEVELLLPRWAVGGESPEEDIAGLDLKIGGV